MGSGSRPLVPRDLFGRWRVVRVAIDDDGEELYRSFVDRDIFTAYLTLASGPGPPTNGPVFADNLVPHVLRIDGVLEADPALVARIDAGTLLAHDSPEEVELRACALHAVELLVAAHPAGTTATTVDNVLWHRGAGARYKAHPRHRARTTAY